MGSATFSTAGDFTWTTPVGVFSYDREVWGGSGYGGAGGTKSDGGVGAGGGAYVRDTGVATTPSSVTNVHVGADGTSITIDGDASYVDTKSGCLASAGKGGDNGGAGGTTAASIGTIKFPGGNGGAKGSGGGGGGGSSAGPAAAGVDGVAGGASLGGAGGTAPAGGGNGGAGGDTGLNGSAGTAPAGGGGGAGFGGSPGAGRSGKVHLTWVDPPEVLQPTNLVWSPVPHELEVVLNPPEVLQPTNLVWSPALDPPAIALDPPEVLQPTNLVWSPALDPPAITIDVPGVLQPTNLVWSPALDPPAVALGVAGELGPDQLVWSPALDPPAVALGVAGELGPDQLVWSPALDPPAVAPFLPSACWRMYRDQLTGGWILDGGGGYVRYGMSQPFKCRGSNVFDVLLHAATTNPIPASVTVVPFTEATCPCPGQLSPNPLTWIPVLYPPTVTGGVSDPCCQTSLPSTIYMHITGHGLCACLSGTTVPLTRNILTNIFVGNIGSPTPCGGIPYPDGVIGFFCAPDVGCPSGDRWFAALANQNPNICAPTSLDCSAFEITITGLNGYYWGCGGFDPADTFDVTFDLNP